MADKKFNIIFDVDANIGPVKTAVSNLQSALSKINIPDSFKKGLSDTFTKLDNEIKNFESIASKGFTNLADVNKAEKSFDRVTDLLSKLRTEAARLKGVDPNKLLPKETIDKTKALHSEWVKLKAAMDKGFGNTAEIAKQNQELDKQNNKLTELQGKYNDLAAANKTMGTRRGTLSQSLDADTKKTTELVAKMQELEKVKGGNRTAEYKQLSSQLEVLNGRIKRNQTEYDNLGKKINENKTAMAGYSTQIASTENTVSQITTTIEQLKSAAQQTPEGLTQLREKLAEIKGVNLDEIPTDIDAIGREIQDLNADQVRQLTQSIDELEPPLKEATNATQDLGDAMSTASGQIHEMTAREKEIEQLANRVKTFFSIGNTVQLFKRAVKSAIDTVKELDEVMTQAAVVTSFDVSGMWAQLPEYTKRANELGVTVKGVYEASTLYYQQGLETEQVIGVTNETLKMAKIAGLDYATATDYMTSALRGFNMEVNELSAQKVNDIYSQLAAKTASNVEEISIAMSKVAPLAHNAGMEIETTAAMLAQMIEKTREAPETLGTAMKTVIARFQELKKDPALIEPVDGEMVDANKVETALNTIGVALRDTSGQFRQLDDVFLEISQKWNSLDVNTQRYIATIAAGSRQQSRFIAMMADYARTTNLVNLANNAAGASAEQFEKTQASLATALNRLQNAWDQFAMGLSNNQVIKIVIDLITDFINIINKVIDKLSLGSGLLKSVLNLGALLGGIKLARAAFTGFFGWFTKAGKSTGDNFSKSFNQNLQKVSLKTRTWSKEITNQFKKTFQTKGNINFNDLIKEFGKFPEAVKKEIGKKAPEIGRALIQEFRASIHYNELNEAGKAMAESIEQDFIKEISDGEIDQALLSATQKLSNAEFSKFGGQNFNANLEVSKQGIEKLTASFSGLSQGVGAAGSFLNNFASILDGLGLKGAADAVRGLGSGFTVLGGIVSSVGAIMTAAGISTKMAWIEVAAIIAAVMAVAIAVIAIIKNIKANSLESRMKRAAEETKKAQEAADKAREAYEELIGDKDKYTEIQDKLKGLTYGTLEWKQALYESNQEVLGLIQKYKFLSDYLNRGAFGQLVIDEKGWNELLEWQQEGATVSNDIITVGKIKQSNLDIEKALGGLGEDTLEAASGLDLSVYAGVDLVKELRRQNQEGHIVTSEDLTGENEELAEFLVETFHLGEFLDHDAEGIQFLTNEDFDGIEDTIQEKKDLIDDYLNDVYHYIEETEHINTQIAAQISAGLEAGLSDDVRQNLGNSAKTVVDYFGEQLASVDVDTLPDFNADNFKEEYADKIAKTGGSMTGDELNDLQVAYAALTGQLFSTIKENYTDKGDLKSLVQKALKGKEMRENLNIFSEAFSELNGFSQKQLLLAMSGGQNYKQEKRLTDSELKSLYDSNDAYSLIYTSYQKFIEAYDKGRAEGQKLIDDSKNKLKDAGIDIKEDFGTGLDAGAVSGFSEKILKVFEVSGAEAASSLANSIQKTINKISNPEDVEKFSTVLNSIDWSKTEQIEQLSDQMYSLAKSSGLSEKDLNELENQLITLNKAARTVNLEKIAEQIKTLSKIQYDIKAGTQTGSFSESDYKALIDAGVASAGDFVYNLATDSWNYISGSMDDLSLALDNNTEALLGQKDLERSIEISEAAKNAVEEVGTVNYNDPQSLVSALQQFYDNAGQGNGIVSQDWIDYNKDDIEALTAKWREVIGEAVALEDRSAKLEEVKQTGKTIEAQNNEGYYNVVAASGLSQEELLKQRSLASGAFPIEEANEFTAALIAQGKAAGVSEEIINRFITALDEGKGISAGYYAQQIANISSIYEEAKANDIDAESVKKLSEYYIQNGTYMAFQADQANALALAILKQKQGLDSLSNNYETWSNNLRTMDRNSDEYRESLIGMQKAVKQLTNSSKDLSEEFLTSEDTLQMVQDVLDGTEGSVEKLQKAIGNDILGEIKFKPEDDPQSLIDGILDLNNNPEIEIGTKINDNEFLNGLYDMMVSAGAGVDEIQNLFNTLGWDPEFEKIPIASDAVQGQEIEYEDPVTGEKKKYKVNSEEVAAGYITVPKKPGSQHSFTKTGFDANTVASTLKGLGSGSKGGGGGGSEPEWENPYDKLYSITKQINGELRIREQLEKRYQRLLNTHAETGKLLKENIDQQIASLERQNKLQEKIRDERLNQIKELEAENSDLSQYAHFDETIGVGGEVQIEWGEIQKVDEANNEELGKRIEDYISKMEEWADSRHEAIDAIEDNTDAIIELQQIGKEQYKDLEDRTLAALISEQQKIIDEQEKINNSINEANEALTDAISKNIEKVRQDRQNQETETSLAEKERRLAYLRQDTTGSNSVEIKKLEKDLEKERQNYTDSLIDQSLNDLKEQNDAAAKQREKQIELMQSQLDWQEKTGYYADEATTIVKEGLGPNGVIDKSSRMYKLLESEEDTSKLSNASQQEWFEELKKTIAEAFVYNEAVSNPDIMSEMITARENNNISAFTALESQRNEKIRAQGIEDKWPETAMTANYNAGKGGQVEIEGTNYRQDYLDKIAEGNWAEAFKFAGMRDKKIESTNGGIVTYESLWEVFDLWLKGGQRFASGGLADYTGPAWLDGTKSRPEMVLNARDTQNFLELRDILSSMAASGTGNSSVGNFYCDIDINVGEISNDYDVDRIAARIKQSIYEDSTYRNVNAINFLK